MSQNNSFQQNDPSLSDGPQFGLEEKEGWISRYGGSVILPIIALLILAGGIYLYASQKSEEIVKEDEQESADLADKSSDPEIVIEDNDIVVIDEPATEEIKENVIEIVPEAKITGEGIVETATRGEGVTHLARRALKHYLEDNTQGLTNEHKVFVEDYLKDKTGSRPLEVNEEVSFSREMIQEAIDASLSLTPEQLKNLEQYSALVAW